MITELVVDVQENEIAIALVEDKRLVELNKEKSNIQFTVGDIYLGRVKKIMPGLNAAFVDVGYEKDAFLHYLDLGSNFLTTHSYTLAHYARKVKTIPVSKFKFEKEIPKNGKIGQILTVGQPVLVQIAKEPISTKGPRLTSEISIAGRNIVLIPFADNVSVSQKISSQEERKRLKRLIQSIVPKNYGVIVRTAAEGKKVAVLDAELRSLLKKWEGAVEKLKTAPMATQLACELKRTSAILRDMLNGTFNSITINNEGVYHDIREYIETIAPEKEKIVKLYKGNVPIFDEFNLSKQIKTVFGRIVSIKSGAYLYIERTEALHVIDVNSGNRSKSTTDQENNAFEVNLAAADEIARQLRLRDLGGIIVVDFIDMHMSENRNKLYEHMRELMAKDRAKHNILPLSKFGLMQITRQRVRPEMQVNTQEKCPVCQGSGEVAPTIILDEQIENKLALIASTNKSVILKTHPYIAAFITKDIISKRLRWSWKYSCKLKVMPMSSYNFLEYHFFDPNDIQID